MVRRWLDLGIVPVFAAGNNGPSAGSVASPAGYPEAIAVGATDTDQSVPRFSARGPVVWQNADGLGPAAGHRAGQARPRRPRRGRHVHRRLRLPGLLGHLDGLPPRGGSRRPGARGQPVARARQAVGDILRMTADDIGAPGVDPASGYGQRQRAARRRGRRRPGPRHPLRHRAPRRHQRADADLHAGAHQRRHGRAHPRGRRRLERPEPGHDGRAARCPRASTWWRRRPWTRAASSMPRPPAAPSPWTAPARRSRSAWGARASSTTFRSHDQRRPERPGARQRALELRRRGSCRAAPPSPGASPRAAGAAWCSAPATPPATRATCARLRAARRERRARPGRAPGRLAARRAIAVAGRLVRPATLRVTLRRVTTPAVATAATGLAATFDTPTLSRPLRHTALAGGRAEGFRLRVPVRGLRAGRLPRRGHRRRAGHDARRAPDVPQGRRSDSAHQVAVRSRPRAISNLPDS